MKKEEKEQARKLRREGKSVREITELVGVSKSSVSLWVRDIELTPDQETKLAMRSPYSYQQGGKKTRDAAMKIRSAYQEQGREKARTITDPLFYGGCMLYWGEGAKNKNMVDFGNSEIPMVRLFKKFLETFFSIDPNRLKIQINCYNDYHTVEEIEVFWLKELNLTREQVTKTVVNNRSRASNKKGRKLEYGTCSLRYCSTEIVQEIFGAIQEFGQFTNKDWLG